MTYDAAAVLQREVGARMAERLGIIRLAPGAILDAGCGTGEVARRTAHALSRRTARRRSTSPSTWRGGRALRSAPAAAGDPSLLARLLGRARGSRARAPRIVCGDIDRLPLPAALRGSGVEQPGAAMGRGATQAFEEFHRVLAVAGLLSFTTLGPDTLRELRTAFAAADAATHVNRFVDMHDLGDMLVESGFADPVMDMEMLTLTYADADGLMRELKAMGTHNADRRPAPRTDRTHAVASNAGRVRSLPPRWASSCVLRNHLRPCVETVAAHRPGRTRHRALRATPAIVAAAMSSHSARRFAAQHSVLRFPGFLRDISTRCRGAAADPVRGGCGASGRGREWSPGATLPTANFGAPCNPFLSKPLIASVRIDTTRSAHAVAGESSPRCARSPSGWR